MRTIAQIITDAGGAPKIAELSNQGITVSTVYKWPSNGIRDVHWPLLIELAATSADELLHANKTAREVASGLMGREESAA